MPTVLSSLLVAAVTTVLAAGGCGQANNDSSGNFKGEAKQVAKAVEDLQSAARSGDQEKICNQLLAKALVQRIEAAGKGGNGSCPAAVKHVLRDVDGFELDVQKVTVSGTTATARVKNRGSGHHSEVTTLTLVKEGSPPDWRIGTLGP
jgi:predicted lipid-binding transport protein (Tim44 family)